MNTRRSFLKKLAFTSCATLLFKVNLNAVENTLDELNEITFLDSSFKALVFIMLAGGNDSANMLVDYEDEAYNDYSAIRPNLKLKKEELEPLKNTQNKYAVNKKLLYLASLFDNNELAFIANVGTLIEPLRKNSFENKIKPPHLYSHSTQKKHWFSMQPLKLVKTGWGGRIADALSKNKSNDEDILLPHAYGIGNNSLFLTSSSEKPYIFGKDGVFKYHGLKNETQLNFFKSINQEDKEENRLNDLVELYKKLLSNTVEKTAKIDEILNSNEVSVQIEPENKQDEHTSSLKQKLLLISEIINRRDKFKLKRQIFYVSVSGYDTHNNQKKSHTNLYTDLDKSLASFDKRIKDIKMSNNVLTFIGSDFGRTITTNETGTDHGWGGHYFAFGGMIKGGKVYGKMPSLKANSSDLTNKNRLIPTTSVEEYLYPICKWFGIDDENVKILFPHYEALTNKDNEDYVKKDLDFIKSNI